MAVKPLMIAPPAVFLAMAALFYVGMQRENPDELPSQFVGNAPPPIAEATLPGIPGVSPEALANGDIRLVNFWASWCPPCRAEHPRLMALQAEGVAIAGVNMRDQQGDAVEFLQDLENPFVGVAFDPRGRTSIDWGVTAPPETFIVSKDGTVLYRHIGPLVGTDFERRFMPALEAALSAE
ncbi:MAG: DsbE family thiol:disulfide interchange protein [Pseudomonadota bacterium]